YQTKIPASPLGVTKLIYANRTFFALGWPRFTSPDGINWTPHDVDVPLNSLAYANGAYIGVGDYGAILQSDPVPPDNPSCRLGLALGRSPQLTLFDAASRAVRIESSPDPGAPNSWQALTNLYPTASP